MEAYTAMVVQRSGCWIGWVAEVPGVNAQAVSRETLMEDLRSALGEALEMNRADARAAVGDDPFEEVPIILSAAVA